MADKILGSDIVDQSVEVELSKVEKQLSTLIDRFVQSANAAKLLNAALKNAGSSEEVAKGIGAQNKQLTEMEKLQKQVIDANQRLVNSETKLNETLMLKRMQLVENNKEIRESIKANRMKEGSIDQLNAKLVQMKRAYTELAQAERDAAKGQQMLVHIQATRTEVGKLEATMGMYHKNVGNYTNATLQMTQVLREVPNFAQSAEIGIRSLSNNLPMLIDSFAQVKKEAGGTGPALKIFATSMLSLSGIVPIALTLFIAYYDQIAELVMGTEKMSEAQKKLNADLKESTKQYADTIASAKVNLQIVKDTNAGYTERSNAYDALNSAYPELLSNMTKEEALNGGIAASYDGIILAIERTMKKKAQYNLLEAAISERTRVEQEIQRLTNPQEGTFTYFRDDVMVKLNRELKLADDRIKAINDSIIKQQEIEAGALGSGLYKRVTGGKITTTSSTNNNPKKEKLFTVDIPDLAPTDEELKNIENYYKRLEESVKKYYKEYINTEDFKKALAQDELEMLADMDKLTTHAGDRTGGDAIDLNNLLMNRRKQTKIDDREKESRTKAYFELVQNGLQAISTISNAVYDRENAQLTAKEKKMNDYYDQEERRVKQSGKTQAEQQESLAKLDAQREAQQKKIDQDRATAQRKAASRQKAIDILQIIANTALAVTAALKEGDPYTKIVRAAAAGVLGGAQLAAVIATPLPQYKDGIGIGNGEHKGGHAIVGDGGEHELIVEPSGKTYISPSKSTIMNLPAKTKVIPQHKLLKMVTDATHVSLANTNTPITESMYINEMINQYEKLASKVDNLTNVMEAKSLQTNIYSDHDHNLHVQKNRF